MDANDTEIKESTPVVVAEDPAAGVLKLAVAYFDNIASMLRHKTSWQIIARLIGYAKGHAVDSAELMAGYEQEKQRRHDIRLQERSAGRKVKHG